MIVPFSKEMDSSLGTENITADLINFGVKEERRKNGVLTF